jgi:hypothetical protein
MSITSGNNNKKKKKIEGEAAKERERETSKELQLYRTLHESEFVLIGESLSLFEGNGSLFFQITLVSDQNDRNLGMQNERGVQSTREKEVVGTRIHTSALSSLMRTICARSF